MKYEEEIKALSTDNEIIRQEKGGKGLVPSTPTLQGPVKQPREELDQTV